MVAYVWQGERHADEESSEDEWSDEEDTDTPIDSIDPFIVFADTVRQLQAAGSPRFQVCSPLMCMLSMLSCTGSCLSCRPVRKSSTMEGFCKHFLGLAICLLS